MNLRQPLKHRQVLPFDVVEGLNNKMLQKNTWLKYLHKIKVPQ